MLKVIIIDDEPACVLSLNMLIEDEYEDLIIVGSANNIEEAVELIDKKKPDLVFLDIELGDKLSFEIFNLCEYKNFKTIFCTAHTDYALNAFDYSAIHYLLKPITTEKLKTAIERLPKTDDISTLDKKLKSLFDVVNVKKETIILPTNDGHEIFDLNDIIRCEAGDFRIETRGAHCTTVFFNNRKPLVVSKLIQKFEEELKDSGFVRVHSADIVNLKFVKKYYKGKGAFLELKDGKTITIADSKVNKFKEKLALYSKQV